MRRDFLTHEAEEILQTKICKEGTRDHRVWKYHPKGKYTVSSGYYHRVRTMEKLKSVNSPGTSKSNCDWWESLWKLLIPPKFKIFLWQVAWDILPIEANLAKKHVPTSPSCSLCGFSTATSIHAIFYCPFAKRVWKDLSVYLPKDVSLHCQTLDFLPFIFHSNTLASKEITVAAMWGIWHKRCEVLHNEKKGYKMSTQPLSLQCIHCATSMVEEFKKFKEKTSNPAKSSMVKSLKRFVNANPNAILVFTNASFFPDSGRSACRLILVNGRGEILGFKSVALGVLESSLEAEFIAINLGLREAALWKAPKLGIFSDCLEAIKAINEKETL